MSVFYKRITIDKKSKNKGTWIKSVYILGLKVAVWEYHFEQEKNNLGF